MMSWDVNILNITTAGICEQRKQTKLRAVRQKREVSSTSRVFLRRSRPVSGRRRNGLRRRHCRLSIAIVINQKQLCIPDFRSFLNSLFWREKFFIYPVKEIIFPVPHDCPSNSFAIFSSARKFRRPAFPNAEKAAANDSPPPFPIWPVFPQGRLIF